MVVAFEEAADGLLGGADVEEFAIGIEVPGGFVVGAAVPEGDVGIDGGDGAEFWGKCGSVEGGLGAERAADQADAALVDVGMVGEEVSVLADVPNHTRHAGPAAEALVDFFADSILEAGVVAVAADVGPGGEDDVALVGEPGAPPVFGLLPVGRGGGPGDDGGATLAGLEIFGDEQECGLVEVDFEGELDVVAEVGRFVGGGDVAGQQLAVEPATVLGCGLEFAEDFAPLGAEVSLCKGKE